MQRKFIAGGLAATFAFGTVGSGFAGAMKDDDWEEYDSQYLEQNVNQLVDHVKSSENKITELLSFIPNSAEEILKIILGKDYDEKKKNYVFEPKKVIDDKTKEEILEKFIYKKASEATDGEEKLKDEDKENLLKSLTKEELEEWFRKHFLSIEEFSYIIKEKKVEIKFESDGVNLQNLFSEQVLETEKEKLKNDDYKKKSEKIKHKKKKKKSTAVNYGSGHVGPNDTGKKITKEGFGKAVIDDFGGESKGTNLYDNKTFHIHSEAKKNKVNKKVLIKAIVSIFIIAVIACIIVYFATRSSDSAKINECSSKKEEQNGQGEPTDTTKQPESKKGKDGKGTESAEQNSVSSDLTKWGVGTAGGLAATSLVAAKDIYSESSKNSGVKNKTEIEKESSASDSKLIDSKGSSTSETDEKTNNFENSKEKEEIKTKE